MPCTVYTVPHLQYEFLNTDMNTIHYHYEEIKMILLWWNIDEYVLNKKSNCQWIRVGLGIDESDQFWIQISRNWLIRLPVLNKTHFI